MRLLEEERQELAEYLAEVEDHRECGCPTCIIARILLRLDAEESDERS